jgi:hypothetical protein
MDSNYLRQMSLQNAQLALDQAKYHAQFPIESNELWSEIGSELAKRINGGGSSFENLDARLTIKGIDKINKTEFSFEGREYIVYGIDSDEDEYKIILMPKVDGVFAIHKAFTINLSRRKLGTEYRMYWNSRTNSVRIYKHNLKTPMALIETICSNFINKYNL